MRVVTSSIGTVLEQIIQRQTGLGMSCAECKDDIAILNSMTPCDVLASVHKHAGRIVNRAMSRNQPWYIRLTSQHLPKFATAVVSDWIRESCDQHTAGEFSVAVQVIPDAIREQRPSLTAGELPTMIPCPGKYDGRCIVITSLSPNPLKCARQIHCVQSWNAFGLTAIAVNTSEAFAAMSPQLLSLVNQDIGDDTPSLFGRRTQTISSLIAAGIRTGLPFIILNSDIEIYSNGSWLNNSLAAPESITIGVRWNYQKGKELSSSRNEVFGLDAFVMTPALASTLPANEFNIGMPAWDWFLPYHFRLNGIHLRWLKSPCLFHEDHQQGWSQSDWEVGAGLMQSRYGVRIDTTAPTFRELLEMPQ